MRRKYALIVTKNTQTYLELAEEARHHGMIPIPVTSRRAALDHIEVAPKVFDMATALIITDGRLADHEAICPMELRAKGVSTPIALIHSTWSDALYDELGVTPLGTFFRADLAAMVEAKGRGVFAAEAAVA